ncbi:MAG: hypothetical protein NT169_27525 [Chloroflexi bacterium]|nr:hypothetical protein [Chloroflexota bacterium]
MMWQLFAAALRPLRREDGIENVEWIALAAIILVMLVVVGSMLKVGGQPIGQLIVDQILSWLGLWAPS